MRDGRPNPDIWGNIITCGEIAVGIYEIVGTKKRGLEIPKAVAEEILPESVMEQATQDGEALCFTDPVSNAIVADALLEQELVIDPKAAAQLEATAAGNTMKSGYGVSNTVTATVSTSAPMSHYTYGQTAVSYFPEFNYTTYWRLLDRLSSGRTARFQFAENIYSTYKQRVHFSPVWFPDGSYTVNTHVMDIWTPAGMLCANLTDSVTISGSLYDDWHIAPGNP